MSTDKKETLKASVFAVILIFSIIGLLYIARALNLEVEIPENPIRVSLIIEGKNWVITYSATTLNNTVFSFLIEASQKLNFSVHYIKYKVFNSVLIYEINGSRNGDGRLWWQYWVNGNYGEVGSDRKALKDGDCVEWRFAPYG